MKFCPNYYNLSGPCDQGCETFFIEKPMSKINEVLTDFDLWATLCGIVALVGLYCYLGAA